jgi:hypothetical protein
MLTRRRIISVGEQYIISTEKMFSVNTILSTHVLILRVTRTIRVSSVTSVPSPPWINRENSPLFLIFSRILSLPIYRARTLTFSQVQPATPAPSASPPDNPSTTMPPLPKQPTPCPMYHGTAMVPSPTAMMSWSCGAISSTWCRCS